MISKGCGGRDSEAPHMYKKGDYYYLMNAEVDYTLCKHLATEVVISMFTGVMCGVFVYGDKKEIAVNNYNYEYDPYS